VITLAQYLTVDLAEAGIGFVFGRSRHTQSLAPAPYAPSRVRPFAPTFITPERIPPLTSEHPEAVVPYRRAAGMGISDVLDHPRPG
jgi:hypothetical protein